MTFLQEILLYGIVALAVFFIVDGFFNYIRNTGDRGDNRVKRRLMGIRSALALEQSEHQGHLEKDSKDIDTFFIEAYLKRLLLHSDTYIPVARLYFVMIILVLMWFVVLSFLIGNLPFAVMLIISLGLGIYLPIMFLKMRVNARNNKLEEQFPDALELIIRSLRVGRPMSMAIKAVADEMSDPIAKEFDMVAQDIAYGKNVTDAIGAMSQRITFSDLKFFVVAVQIQYESGGNLAEILEGLSKIIRDRFRLLRKMRALTAEGRFSAWFLSLFPFGMAFIMNVVNPGYYQSVMDFPYFIHLTAITVMMLLTNIVAMRVITNLKV